MTLKEIRILPPLAIGRLGSSPIALENYELVAPEHGLGARKIVPAPTLYIDETTGAVSRREAPSEIQFRDGDKIRPVAPFLEVHVLQEDSSLTPLTLGMLQAAEMTEASVKWTVRVGNIKAYRRTGDDGDKAIAEATFSDHSVHELHATAASFLPNKTLPLGSVRYIKPTRPEDPIRLRFTPAAGLVYGASEQRIEPNGRGGFESRHDKIVAGRIIYDGKRPGQKWLGWKDPGSPTDTNPGQIYAGFVDKDGNQTSWGYLDDECDGIVEVEITTKSGELLKAFARIGAGPPNFAPDGLPIRTINDELLQAALGPRVATSEISRADAEDIIRRAYETVRNLNTAVMNGNPVDGRPSRASTMVTQDSNDTHRLFAPIMANEIVDNLSLRALHESLFVALKSGAPPWFVAALRQPEEIGDLSDAARRKMPAMMRGADARYLTLTRRQIDTIRQLAEPSGFEGPVNPVVARNRTARIAALRYRGDGNPPVSHPSSAISNCFPGLEFDARNMWRRIFVGIVLTEHNNYVEAVEDPRFADLKGCRLLAIQSGEPTPTMTQARGPAFPRGDPTEILGTAESPAAVAFKEWSNTIALFLESQGKLVSCIFTEQPSDNEVFYDPSDKTLKTKVRELELRRIFEAPDEGGADSKAVLSRALAQAGEMSQGLCSPWQNDYRECACYYWAASRPDYVNVEPDGQGGSRGDMWLQRKLSGEYVPDTRTDELVFNYDDLFSAWEKHLRFVIDGRAADIPHASPPPKSAPTS